MDDEMIVPDDLNDFQLKEILKTERIRNSVNASPESTTDFDYRLSHINGLKNEVQTNAAKSAVRRCIMLPEVKFQKRLIVQIRKHRELYDTSHQRFTDDAAKEAAWANIAKDLKTNVDSCKNTWANLRFNYQRYVRRLRKFFRNGYNKTKHRPAIALEADLLFLWRFVADRSMCPLPLFESVELAPETKIQSCDDDDVVMLEDEPVEVIDLEAIDNIKPNNFKKNAFVVTTEVRRLVELIREYAELYDSDHQYFNDYKRKGIIWNAIANELNDKATKLMKFWIHLQTRYECEMVMWKKENEAENTEEKKKKSDLMKLLKFLEPYIHTNSTTVYKQSYYLRNGWTEPIDHFKNIFNLLAAMKKHPKIVPLTDKMTTVVNKEKDYFKIWSEIANLKGFTPGQCEITWLILRSFYWELMKMRKHSYQLQDKWYFEAIITELYNYAENLNSTAVNAQKKTTPVTVDRIDPLLSAAKATIAPPILVPAPTTAPKPSVSSTTPAAPILLPTPTALIAQTAQILPKAPTSASTVAVNLDEDRIMSSRIERSLSRKSEKRNWPFQISTNRYKLAKKLAVPQPQISSARSLAPKNATQNASISAPTSSTLPLQLPRSNENVNQTCSTLPVKQPERVATKPQQMPTLTHGPSERKKLPVMPPTIPISLPTLSQPTTATITATTVDLTDCDDGPPPLPKITSAISLLNPNEIMIELIASPHGNQLVVHGPPLAEKYSLSMAKTSSFIREIMAIPLLHSKVHSQSSDVNFYWQYLSMKFNIPTHICKACWNFLSENFAHFPQIAPMDELMKPFKIDLKVWKESPDLFVKFDTNAVQMGWTKYLEDLPDLMEVIGENTPLHKEYAKYNNGAPTNYNEVHVTMIWRTIRMRFSQISSILDIWMAFRNVFWYYMNDLELGIDNKWPLRWWRVLAKLEFLVNFRYSDKEPFYYIVHNKLNEEVERCKMAELKAADMAANSPQLTINGLTTPQLTFEDGIPNYNFIIKVNEQQTATPIPTEISTNKIYKAPTAPSEKVSSKTPQEKTVSEIDAYTLLLVVRRHPQIFQNCDTSTKFLAWEAVAKELNTTANACRLTFQRALKNYFIFMTRDPANRCRINHRYFNLLKEIYRVVKPQRKLNIKTPSELNQSIQSGGETVFPERFILDINMDSSKPALVLKNWTYGLGTLTVPTQRSLERQLSEIFDKYRPYAVDTTEAADAVVKRESAD